jgi:Zn finger protein HypA/HybF involved in hydrogenase expression
MNEITYAKYDNAMAVAYLEIGALKEKLRYSESCFQGMRQIAEEKAAKLVKAELILSENLQLEWCSDCKNYTSTDYTAKTKAGSDGPEEGSYFCESCGSLRGEQ